MRRTDTTTNDVICIIVTFPSENIVQEVGKGKIWNIL